MNKYVPEIISGIFPCVSAKVGKLVSLPPWLFSAKVKFGSNFPTIEK